MTDEAASRTRGLSQCLDPTAGPRLLSDLLSGLSQELSQRFHRPVSAEAPATPRPLNAYEHRHLHHAIVDAVRYAMLHKGIASLHLSGEAGEERTQITLVAHHRYAQPLAHAGDDVPACMALLRRRLGALGGEVETQTETGRFGLQLRWPAIAR